MSKNILCKLGFHEWIYYPRSYPKGIYVNSDMRVCEHCGRTEVCIELGKDIYQQWHRVENYIEESIVNDEKI